MTTVVREGFRKCAGAIIFNSKKEVIIGKRNAKFLCWQFPQGGVDEGESFVEAASREAEEELGINRASLQYVSEIPEIFHYAVPTNSWMIKEGFRGQGIKFSLFFWDGSLDSCDINKVTDGHPPEFTQLMWLSISNWDDIVRLVNMKEKSEIYASLKEPVIETITSFVQK